MSLQPILLPEDQIPIWGQDYSKCEICTRASRLIWGEGNPNAQIMVILDNPGAREDKECVPFICGARQALQMGIRQAGIALDDIYVTYLLKCRPRRAYNKEEVYAFSKPFLLRQIELSQPRFLVCLGNVVVQVLLEDNNASVKQLRGRWHNVLGLPTMISYHPLATRRMPNLASIFAKDWLMLAKALK